MISANGVYCGAWYVGDQLPLSNRPRPMLQLVFTCASYFRDHLGPTFPFATTGITRVCPPMLHTRLAITEERSNHSRVLRPRCDFAGGVPTPGVYRGFTRCRYILVQVVR